MTNPIAGVRQVSLNRVRFLPGRGPSPLGYESGGRWEADRAAEGWASAALGIRRELRPARGGSRRRSARRRPSRCYLRIGRVRSRMYSSGAWAPLPWPGRSGPPAGWSGSPVNT